MIRTTPDDDPGLGGPPSLWEERSSVAAAGFAPLRPATTPAADATLVQRFEQRVEAVPDALAVEGAGARQTYAELDRGANRIAQAIVRSLGRDPAPVALVFESGPAVIQAMLGVWKAGKFYVAIDPGHPAARNDHVVADAAPALFLASALHADAARRLAPRGVPVLVLEEMASTVPVERPDLLVRPGDLAWLIYTSGSTGKPKGVVQNHRNAVHNVERQQPLAAWTAGDRLTWLYSPSVMGATRGLTAALLNGAALFPHDPRQDSPGQFLDWLREERITVYHSVASLFRAMFGGAGPAFTLPDVRLVMFGGERVGAADVELVRRHFRPSCKIYTGLGTTETGTVLHLLVNPAEAPPGPALPLGRPVDGVDVRLVGDRGRNAPPGEVGEIVISSPYLSLGYWRQPALTTQIFGPGTSGVHEYRTGDLGRPDANGMLRHAGRRDFQVKIRGFRVEVGEIEFALQQCAGIRDAVVIGRTSGRNEQWLAAFCVAEPGAALATSEVRQFLLQRLPRHMVPAAIAFLPALPRTANGKIDRRALPAIAPAANGDGGDFARPATPAEEQLAAIWRDVLGCDSIGRHDDFYDLGGHSLAAMQVSARIRQGLGLEIPPSVLLEHSTLAGLAAHLARRPEMPALRSSEPLTCAPRGQPLGLSFAQERLWFLDRLEPGSNAYHISRAFRLSGEIDVCALRIALDAIVARHEVLRTVYETSDGSPVSRVLPAAPIAMPVADLTAESSAGGPEMTLRHFAEQEAARPFDLQRDVLLRAAIGRVAPGDAVLVLTMHHIASDGWSLALLLREITRLYAAACDGDHATLPSLNLQYADFAAWERRRLAGPALERLLAFWRRSLDGAPPLLELPPDFPRPPVSSGRGAVHRVSLAPRLRQGMRELAQHAGVTPFVAWLAAFQVLLFRHTGRTDLLVAAPVGGRTHVELEPLIGFFVNTLVFRGQLAGTEGFAEFLARFGRHVREAFAHDDLPFEKLVLELQPPRHAGHAPLVQIMFAWQNAPNAKLAFPGVSVKPLPLASRAAKFDLTLTLEEDGDGLGGAFEYNADLYRPDTIARLAGHLELLVTAILTDPELPLGELSLMNGDERRELLEEWGVGTGAVADASATVLDGIARQVARAPEATMIQGPNGGLSYAAMDELANCYAARLVSLGVKPGSIVGVCLERRVELGAALLGVLKAGAAILPLDPSYPRARLEFMLADSGATVLVVSAATRGIFAASDCRLLEVEAEAPGQGPRASAPAVRALPSDLAYVIYTSGSTGTPKGVAIAHRSLWQHNVTIGAAYSLVPDDRVLQFSALSFDASLEEIFPTWVNGATLVLRNDASVQSIAAFGKYIAEQQITVLNLPTAFWREVADNLPAWPLPSCVRLTAIGGEKASGEHLQRWQRQVDSRVRLLNTYGPTEATISATVFDATTFSTGTVSGGVPIGRPIAGVRAYVLDAQGQPVPAGVWGQLHLAGDCLARGYLNRPETTAERFVPDPFAALPGARMYRTGDIVRWLGDGNLEFLGRDDAQVKWRGFRIELGEIENALRRQPGVSDAVAAVREELPGVPRLIGYVLPAPPAAAMEKLMAGLREALPAFMVPSDLIGLDTLPVTPGGKIDRAALPAPSGSAPLGVVHTFTRTEERLRSVWQEVLGVAVDSPEANFFSLGGHSLLAVRLFARLEAVFGALPPLVELFAAPTLRQLAAVLERARTDQATAAGIVTLKPGSLAPPLFCMHGAGGGMLWGYANMAAHFRGGRPICALPAEPIADPQEPGRLEEMAARHVAHLRALQPHGPYHLAGYCFGGNVAYEMARQLALAGEPIALLAVFDSTPSNSDYYRVRLNRRFVAGFIRNLWLAIDELAHLPPSEQRMRLCSVARKVRARIMRLLGTYTPAAAENQRIEADIEAIVPDRSLCSADELRLWEAHLRMMERYHPVPSPVPMVLFRTRRRPIWRSHEPSLGWAKLAEGGVEIELVPGSHGTLFREPHVAHLAEKLAVRLEREATPQPV